jgi:alanine racemase
VNVHVEVDTGLGRGGCPPDEAARMVGRVLQEPRLTLAGLFTHFSSADRDVPLSDRQMSQLDALLPQLPRTCIVHSASTYALFRHRRFHRSMVRVGMSWAGYAREMMKGRPILAEAGELRPAISWTSQIIQVKRLAAGATVGYGRTWTALRESCVALVPVGYADGYPYALGGPTERRDPAQVAVLTQTREGERRLHAPVIGAVNMDQITIDLTSILERHPGAAVGVGTPVELITPDPAAPNHLVSLARQAGTLPHALLCGLNPRLRRVYVEEVPEPARPRSAAPALAG